MEQNASTPNAIWEQKVKKYDFRLRDGFEQLPEKVRVNICNQYERFDTELKSLLEEYGLQEDLSYFKFLLYMYHCSLSQDAGKQKLISNEGLQGSQLFKALKVLEHTKLEKITLEIKTYPDRVSVTETDQAKICITNTELIKVIKKALKAHADHLFSQSFTEGFTTGDLYRMLADINDIPNKKGRKQVHAQTALIADNLQKTLQKLTPFKAGDGVQITREQARIIFRFLSILGVYNAKEISDQEGTISNLIKRYRQNK